MRPRTSNPLRLTVALVSVLTSLCARAQSEPQVTSVFPVAPLRAGAAQVELGVSALGPVERVLVTARGTSASSGDFASLDGRIVERDAAGAIPFHVLVPLSQPFPSDGLLTVTAEARISGTSAGPPLIVVFDASGPPPSIVPAEIQVRVLEEGIAIEVPYAGQLARAEASVVGVSALALREVSGSLERAEPSAFLRARRTILRPNLVMSPGKVRFLLPLREGAAVPPDGLIIGDVSLTGAFGQIVHASVTELAGSSDVDQLLSVTVEPSPLLLSQGFGQRVPLQVTGHFLLGGDIDLSGAGNGARYSSDNEAVAIVTRDGQVVARENGTAHIDVSIGGSPAQSVEVIVDSAASLEAVDVTPKNATIPRVGETLRLRLEGVLTSGVRTDLTLGALGTVWTSSDPTTLSVDTNGQVRSLRPGFASITAEHAGFTDTVTLEALDGAPSARIVAPPEVVAGSTFQVRALATDDVGVQSVQFLVNEVPAAIVTDAPFLLDLQAPPYGGQTLMVAALVTDTGGNVTTSEAVTVSVTGAAAGSVFEVVYDAPAPGALLVEELPHPLRVTSGDWRSDELGTGDFQVVRFYADGALIGSAHTPRVEWRKRNPDDEQPPVAVPLWEISYLPSTALKGRSVVIRAEAVDRNGSVATGDALVVRVAEDLPPLVHLSSPIGAEVPATQGVPLLVAGTVTDDALAFGATLELIANDGVATSTSVITPSSQGFSGSRAFSLTWTPPASSVGASVRLDVRATDARGNVTVVGFHAVVGQDQPPQVAVLSPAQGASVPTGSTVSLTANVVDESTSGARVTWRVDGAQVGAAVAPPYAVLWEVPATWAGRSVQIEAVASDASGNQSIASVSVAVVADSTPPSVSLVTPSEGYAHVETRDLLVTAAGLDNVGTDRIELLLDGQVVGADEAPPTNAGIPGSFVAHFVLPASRFVAGGSHPLVARAYDKSGNVGLSPTVTFQVIADGPPAVSFLSPAAGAQVTAGSSVEVFVDAADEVGVASVELFVDDIRFASRSLPPYRFAVRLSGDPRVVVLRARATDTGGSSADASIQVNVVSDQNRPLVAFQRPAAGERVFAGRPLEVEVAASDDVDVAAVTLSFAGDPQGPAVEIASAGLYEVHRWTVPVDPALAESTVALEARVTDGQGNSTTRTLEIAVSADTPPRVTVLSPSPGSHYREGEDVLVQLSVQDDDGVIGLVGRSGGAPVAALPTSGPKLDVTSARALTVRAPIVSAGQSATVGAAARDTAGQDDYADVELVVSPDVEAPTALLIAPIPDASGSFQAQAGRSVAVRVEVSDDVRVDRVALHVDGVEQTPGGSAVLSVLEERFEETVSDNPLAPGEILLSRRYRGVFAGTLSLVDVAPGTHALHAEAYDPAGNRTPTRSVSLEVAPQAEDEQDPSVTITLQGAPDARTVVAGSTIDVEVRAVDDNPIVAVELELDGAPLTVPSFDSKQSVRIAVEGVTLPSLPLLEVSRTITFTARATDSFGRTGERSVTRQVVQDLPPKVRVVGPQPDVVLVEEKRETTTLEMEDDTGVARAGVVLSSAQVVAAEPDAFFLAAPAAAPDQGATQVRLEVGTPQSFEIALESGALRVTPQESTSLGADAGRLVLSLLGLPAGTADVRVRYRYRIRPGQMRKR